MKQKLIIMLLCLFSGLLNAQTTSEKKGNWDYPVKPGTEEWKLFQSGEDMVNSCQIPEIVLSSLTTEELFNLCLSYPLIKYIFAFDNLNSGFDKFFGDFNGIREFYKKKDCFIYLLNQYIQLIKDFSFLLGKSTDYEKGKFITSVSLLEVLLSQSVLKNETANENSKEILHSLLVGYEEKLKYSDFFKGVGFRSNVYARIQVIYEIYKNKEAFPLSVNNLAKLSGMIDEQSLRMIDELSYQLIK